MEKYVHDANLTCLAQAVAHDAGHQQIERYTFPFRGPPEGIKEMVRFAVQRALESRRNRGLKSGRLHVELDEDLPGAGRVVDHIPRDVTGNLSDTVLSETRLSHEKETKDHGGATRRLKGVPASDENQAATSGQEVDG
jgi:hypothetical protein